jgi:hypothetical protein
VQAAGLEQKDAESWTAQEKQESAESMTEAEIKIKARICGNDSAGSREAHKEAVRALQLDSQG